MRANFSRNIGSAYFFLLTVQYLNELKVVFNSWTIYATSWLRKNVFPIKEWVYLKYGLESSFTTLVTKLYENYAVPHRTS